MLNDSLPLPLEPAVAPSTVQLYHGDCLEVMPTLEPKSVAMVFADLPYGITRNPWDTPIDLDVLWSCINHITTKPHTTILTAAHPFAAKIICSNISRFRYDLVWDKKLTTGFLNAKRCPLRRHEQILVFASGATVYNPQMIHGEPFKKTPRALSPNYGHFSIGGPRYSAGARYPTSLIAVPSERKKGNHPTQKPLALLEWLIATYTNPGDTVLDPTMGSGVAGLACARLGRNFIGIEKDRGYFDIASKRIADERARLGLTDA